MSTYFDTLTRLAARSVAVALALLELHDSGDLDEGEFAAYAAAAVLAHNTRAAAVADLAVAADLTRALNRPIAPLGVRIPEGERERLVGALVTIQAGEPGDDPERAVQRRRMRVERLADAEPRTAARNARGEAIGRSRHANGWTRSTNPGACKACIGLADGTVLSARTHMWTHTGCGCAQQPTTRKD